MTNSKKLRLKFSLDSIDHLGIKMYRTLPPVLSELISNAYDSDSETVTIELMEGDRGKSIIVTDDGIGMSADEANDAFLIIGRNRRVADPETGNITKNKQRKVTGRKGLGKLAVFGVSDRVTISTVKDGKKTVFVLDLQAIRKDANEGVHEPEVICQDEATNESSGTTLILENIRRKSPFSLEGIAKGIAHRFAYPVDDFLVTISHSGKSISIDRSSKLSDLETQFEWVLPETAGDHELPEDPRGKIVTTPKPLPDDYRGISLFARGKLVNSHEFYGIKTTTSHAYNYMTGVIHVDFVDDGENDFINTSRDGLLWENEELSGLRNWLQTYIRGIAEEWRDLRANEKIRRVNQRLGEEYTAWTKRLPSHERKLANQIVREIILNESLQEDKALTLIEYVRDSFNFEAFRSFALALKGTSLTDVSVIELLQEWKLIEAREFYRLAIGRVETISKLEEYIKTNAREVPVLHNFFKEFPWILEPRISNFRDEVTYSKLLRENFPETSKTLEDDKRIDFLCTGSGKTIFVVELKRPSVKASDKQLDQLNEYCAFIREQFGSMDSSYEEVWGFLVVGGIVQKETVRRKIAAWKTQGMMVKTYNELLATARDYHQDFIEMHESFESKERNIVAG